MQKPIRYFLLLFLGFTAVSAAGALEKAASWKSPGVGEMSSQLADGLAAKEVGPDDIALACKNFEASVGEGADPLDAYVAGYLASLALDEIDLESVPEGMQASVRTWVGRDLTRERLFDEAIEVLTGVEPRESIDPGAVLFYRGTCYFSLLKKEEALADFSRLLENEASLPNRFARVARMMVVEITPLEEDSLDEISRLMADVSRRLDLGRANDTVEQRQQAIIDKLTKLIEKAEQQQQEQQQASNSSGDGQQAPPGASPMEDSQAGGANANGDAGRKAFEGRETWGNLPPAEREEAVQQITRDLPFHYREAIDAYFRKLATQQ